MDDYVSKIPECHFEGRFMDEELWPAIFGITLSTFLKYISYVHFC